MEEKAEEKWLREKAFHEEMISLLTHDLKSPTAVLSVGEQSLEEIFERIENADDSHKLKKAVFEGRLYAKMIGSAGRKIANLSGIVKLGDFSGDELNKRATTFEPYSIMDDVVNAYTHQMVGKTQGAKFYFLEKFSELKLSGNKEAFTSVFSNLFGNAISHAQSSSVINLVGRETLKGIGIELENMVLSPINSADVEFLFEKGYRIEGEDEQNYTQRNEGLGLYFTQKVIRKGFLGQINIRSEDSFQITEAKTKGMNVKEYGLIPPLDFTPLPSFYVEALLKIKKID